MNDKVNILLVDDQPQQLLTFEAVLGVLGENLLKASSGREALDILLKHEVAVILLDVSMPGMDGFETAGVIREHPRFAKTPIIFVTGINTSDLDRLRGYEIGAVDYMFIPVAPEILKAKVSVFVELHRKSSQLAALNRDLEQRVAERTAQLQNHEQRLAQVSRQLLTTQETERRHLARELHDEMGQILTLISVNLKAIRDKRDGDLQPRLDDSIFHVDRVIQQVRSMSLDLRPAMIDDLGLAAALRWFVESQAERAGFKVDLVTESTAGAVPTDVRNACYRVVQEALTNVMRHAKARQVRVKLSQREEKVEVIIQDDGVGFDVAAAFGHAARGYSAGLLGMQERAELLGGTFELKSAPGQGTTIHARFPIPEKGS